MRRLPRHYLLLRRLAHLQEGAAAPITAARRTGAAATAGKSAMTGRFPGAACATGRLTGAGSASATGTAGSTRTAATTHGLRGVPVCSLQNRNGDTHPAGAEELQRFLPAGTDPTAVMNSHFRPNPAAAAAGPRGSATRGWALSARTGRSIVSTAAATRT